MLDNNNYLKRSNEENATFSEEKPAIQTEVKTVIESSKEESRVNKNELDKYEITLKGGIKIALFLPPTLAQKDKERLKMLIDMVPENSDCAEIAHEE